MNRVTGKDVAQRAGVTAATVSYVLSGSKKHSVSQETRDRVIAAARELGYVPDQTTKSLRRRESKAIGVVIEKNLATPRYGWAVQGMLQAASERGYRITLCRNRLDEHGMREYLTAYYERRVDGIVFVGRDNEGPDAASCERIERDAVPFVAFDCQLDDAPFGTVDFDYRTGARDVVQAAFAQHKGRVAYLRPEAESAQERLREAGVRDACRAAGRERLTVLQVPISAKELSAFDLPPALVNDTIGASRVISRGVATAARNGHLDAYGSDDVVVCSWAGWSSVVQLFAGAARPCYVDLAVTEQSMLRTDHFGILPNYEAGLRCVTQLLEHLRGAAYQSVVLPVAMGGSELIQQ